MLVVQAILNFFVPSGSGQAALVMPLLAPLSDLIGVGRQIAVLAHAMGAEGLREQHPFSRHLIGAQVAGFVDGSTEMLLERIAAVLAAG